MTEKLAKFAPLDARSRPFWLTMPMLPAMPAMPRIRSMLLSTAFIALAAALGISSAGGSYASWIDTEQVGGGNITAGTLDLTIADSAGNDITDSSLAGGDWSQLLPGDVGSQWVRVTNSGTTDATLMVSTTASARIDVRAQSGICSGTITDDSLTTTPTALGGTLSGGANRIVCIQVSLKPAAEQNQSAPFTVTFTADQVQP